MFFERHSLTSFVNIAIYVTKGAILGLENLKFTHVIEEGDIGN